ncbi:unnamed protein product, partial [Wuchereria bancrofti]
MLHNQNFYKAAALKTILNNYLFNCNHKFKQTGKLLKAIIGMSGQKILDLYFYLHLEMCRQKKIVMDEISFSFLWTVMLMIVMFVNLNSVSGCSSKKKKREDKKSKSKDKKGAGAKGNREGNEAVVPDGGVIKAPAQGAIAGTFDPNYQTMAGLGNDVFGADKGGVGGGGAGGGASPVVPRV